MKKKRFHTSQEYKPRISINEVLSQTFDPVTIPTTA